MLGFDFFPRVSRSSPCNCDDPSTSTLVTDEASGDVICTGCGVVRDCIISEEAEYRLFSDDVGCADRQRAERVDEFFSMSTTISATGKNKSVLEKTQARISNSYQEKKMLDGFTIIQQYCAILNTPSNVLDEAKNLHFTMGEKRHKYTRGCWTEPMYAATVLAAAKKASFGITFKEVSKQLQIPEKALRKNYAQLLKIVGKETSPEGIEGQDCTTHPSRTSPSLLTNQYGAKLNLPYKVILTINSVAYMAHPFLEGKKPSTVAAAAILVVVRQQQSDVKISEAEIASVAGISQVTLRSAYTCLSPHLSILMPSQQQPGIATA